MPISISEDHRSLASVVGDFANKRGTRAASRALLETADEPLPSMWAELAELGWLGLHLPEEFGGAGYGLEELVVVVEQLGREVAPGPFVPTTIASGVITVAGDESLRKQWLPGLATGELIGAVSLASSVTVAGDRASGDAGFVLGAAHANVLLVPSGDDVLVVEVGEGVEIGEANNVDPTRRSAKVTLRDAPVAVLPGATKTLLSIGRTVLAADAVGVASACTDAAAEYAKQRVQFGRVIAMFQAVKHHCANMCVATEMTNAAVWDAARASTGDPDEFSLAAASAATLAARTAYLCANLNIQVHGGIGYTWEHDAHLYLRRALTLQALLEPVRAGGDIVDLVRSGIVRERTVELPPEAETIRAEVRDFVASLEGLDADAKRKQLVETGYLLPHWPKPWGRDARAVEQLVIEEEFNSAGIVREIDPITGYVMLTLTQQANEDQVARWVPPALAQEVTWCQLFSEPDAGSDAAGIKTRATRTDGGWLLNGQKVWTSGADRAALGLATVRTNPDAPKHKGITTMVVDMSAEGIEIRPLRQLTGQSHFSEVFFNDVFVPDDDVVGPVDGGWNVARATLGNESVSVGNNSSMYTSPNTLIADFDAHPERLSGGTGRLGHYAAGLQSLQLLNLRMVIRAVTGAGPGPEGAITKLVVAELGHEAAAILADLHSPDMVLFEGATMLADGLNLGHRVYAIGGGTSEIKRSQIGERILGLPRDPLLN